MAKGKVYLVGAGPGDPALITVRGAELLGTADCIIYDRLANPALLKFANPAAEIINVPKRIGSCSYTQQEINKLLVEKAGLGQTVVRLKGGDPCIFGRCSEEVAILAEAGIDFEIIPGVTAGIAAADFAGIMLTDRRYSSQVLFITGHEAEAKLTTNIDWQWLAKFTGTIVFYMAVGNLDFIVSELIKNGIKKQTPVAVITNATMPSQRLVKDSLQQISEKCKQQKVEPPAIIIIGTAAKSDPALNWFMKKPLFGTNIVITRDRRGNADLAAKVIQKGANPIQFSAIKIKPLTQTNRFLQIFTKLSDFQWIIFTSVNSVSLFFDVLEDLGKDARVFASAKIAVIGSETSRRLSQLGIKPDFTPTVFTSTELGKQLIRFTNLQGKNILLLRSKLATNELSQLLEQAGAKVTNQPVYTTVTEKSDATRLIEKIKNASVDWLTFASPSSVRGFFEQIPKDLINSSKVKVASIGPVTSEQLRKLDVKVSIEATEHTLDGLLEAIEGMYK
ncbi:MAG: uroporphyrinogen-III C-methyltransferase [Planctomycetota bacterium]|jgi:uroporphyrinogen III methyltransferase/synthase